MGRILSFHQWITLSFSQCTLRPLSNWILLLLQVWIDIIIANVKKALCYRLHHLHHHLLSESENRLLGQDQHKASICIDQYKKNSCWSFWTLCFHIIFKICCLKVAIIWWMKPETVFNSSHLSVWDSCGNDTSNFEKMNCETGGGQEEGAKKITQKVFSVGIMFFSCGAGAGIQAFFFYLAWQQVSGSLNGRVDFRLLAVVYFGSKSRWQVSECEAPLCFFAFLFWVLFFFGCRVCATVQVFGKVVAWQQRWLWSCPNVFMKWVEPPKVLKLHPRTQDRFVVRREKKTVRGQFPFFWATI